MSLLAQNRVRSTYVHSTQALVIVERESNQKLPHLTVVCTLALDEKLDNIVTSVHELITKMSELTSILHDHSARWDMKFTSLQTQLDQIQRKIEEDM